tara:strand:+ start:112 stop:423 length:312 start_codon:yes stop_codon:yes gene_type:complete
MSDVKTHILNNNDGTISLGTTQDYTSIFDQNQYEANNNINRLSDRDTFGRKIASIPLNLINAWCKEWNCSMHELFQDPSLKAKMMARLRDSSYLKLRTDHGRI